LNIIRGSYADAKANPLDDLADGAAS